MVDGYKNAGFENLEVWQIALQFTKQIYKITAQFPTEEKFGLTSQLRRAATSILSNIAEGSARGTDPEFIRFLNMAIGSTAEVKAQLLLAEALEYLSEEDSKILLQSINQIGRMLRGLQMSIKKKAFA